MRNIFLPKEEELFKAPCNITKNNLLEYDIVNDKLICVRFKCGKIKWKCR